MKSMALMIMLLLLMDLETKTSDAVLMDTVVANYMISSAGKDFKVLDETLVADEYAIGFRKGEEALCEAVWNALIELKAEGKIEESQSSGLFRYHLIP